MKLFYTIIITSLFNVCFSQNIDSLVNNLKVSKNDTNKVNTFLVLGKTYAMFGSYDTSINYINEAKLLATKISFERGLAKSHNFLGLVLCEVGDFEKARMNFEKAIEIRQKIGDNSGTIDATMNLGMVYDYQGNFSKALENYFLALKFYDKNDDKSSIASTLNNIAIIYFTQEDFQKSLETHIKSLNIYKTLGDKEGLSQSYNNIGNVLLMLNKLDEAFNNYQKSLSLKKELNDVRGLAATYDNMGSIYKQKHDFDSSLKYYFLSLNLFEEIGDEVGIAGTHNHIGIIYLYQSKITEADKFLNKGLQIASKVGSVEDIKLSYEALTSLDSLRGNYKGAYLNHLKYIEYRDSILNQENTRKVVQHQMQYDFEKKEAIAKTEQEKKDLMASQAKRKQQIILFSVLGGLLLITVFSMYIYGRLKIIQKQKRIIEIKEKETHEQKNIIEEKHKEIHDSINYAKRIQYSLLASDNLLNQNLKDYFLFFKPKDVVSGDFYWGSKLGNDRFVLVTADSTGHGVPGAIMSMLNMSCLNEAINSDKHKEPADILNATRKKVIAHLANDGSEEGGKDGMDCSLCVFDFKSKILKVAAAHNPVWIVRGKEVIEIKPDKMPVGKHDRQDVLFTQHEIQLQTGDVIYTLTDGFPDQFGGEKGKKFMSKNLREFLAANVHLPMSEQKELLEKTFVDWKQDLEQVDDVTVIGIRIS